MEISQKAGFFFLGLLWENVCDAFPINLDAPPADFNTQVLTGLIAVLLTLCSIVFFVGCLWCQRHKGFKEFHNAPVLASSTSSLDHGLTNPITNGEFTIFTPLSPFQQNSIFLAHEQIVQNDIDSNQAGVNIQSWFDGTQVDFPRAKLKYIRELGKGWFGRVVEGAAQGLSVEDEAWTSVAVRILEASATNSQRAVFLHDARIYRAGQHPNILQLLGRNLESIPLLLLQELCPKGDLKKFLLDNQKTPEKILNSELPLLWCCQISSALQFLHDNHLTHPDLSTRNCQVASDSSLKLGDYGLAASLYPQDYYQGAPAVPVRWCAPESLIYTSTTIQPKEITYEGNVWSLGVTMWEIFECGAQPYAHLSDDEVISHVLGSSTVRLPVPKMALLYTNYIYRLMQLCWSTYELRPSVTQVHLMLTDLMQVYQNTKDLPNTETFITRHDFDNRWSAFKPNSITRTDNFQFTLDESKSETDGDISVLNLNLDDVTKVMSPSLNNLHGSLDNLNGGEMDSWLQNLASKTGDMSYVRGLSEAFNDLDNTLAMENVSSSESSYLPSPTPDVFIPNKLEFKLGPTENTSIRPNEMDKTQDSSFTESTQRTSSDSETEDETWRRKVEQGAYSEKVHQKSKSVTDLMILTHIDYSESESETPLPSLDYRVNYKNVRYAPLQNLENVSLIFGSEGNLLTVHDKFQEELKRMQEERKDSLLFVPETSISHDKSEESGDTICRSEVFQESTGSLNTSPRHGNSEALIEELSSPRKIQPESQVYNIFNVRVDSRFCPNLNNFIFDSTKPSCSDESVQHREVPKLMDIIQNNDDLMDYIIATYDSPNCLQPPTSEEKLDAECKVQFDLSVTQEELLPCSMTHSAVCTNNTYNLDDDLEFSSNFNHYANQYPENQTVDTDLIYSLETWDNFLQDALDRPAEFSNDFTSFPSESQSSIEESKAITQIHNSNDNLTVFDETYEISDKDSFPSGQDVSKTNDWEHDGGWFLHPQTNSDVSGQLDTLHNDNENYVKFSMDDEVMAAIRNELLLKLPQAQGPSSEVVRDYEECDPEERNEIHIKYNVYTTPLSPIPEESYSENDACYYICNKEDNSDTEGDDEWPAPFEEERNSDTNVETHSLHNADSPGHVIQNRHTPSQDSCCSNDTLFNLEELCINEVEITKERNNDDAKILKSSEEEIKTDICGSESQKKGNIETINSFAEKMAESIILNHFNEHLSAKSNTTFLVNNNSFSKVYEGTPSPILDINDTEGKLDQKSEIKHRLNSITHENEDIGTSHICNVVYCTYIANENEITDGLKKPLHCCLQKNGVALKANDLQNDDVKSKIMNYLQNSASDINQNDNTIFDWELTHKTNGSYSCKYIVDNSEKDHINFDGLDNRTLIEADSDYKHLNEADIIQDNFSVTALNFKNKASANTIPQGHTTETLNNKKESLNYITKFLDYERQDITDNYYSTDNKYVNIDDIKVNIITDLQPKYANVVHEEHLYDVVDSESCDYDIYDVLTDIRFNGPSDIQLMSTSFSESADVDEQDWDSGSDTRSSSSGEFIWKEGEHEESIKALRAAPQSKLEKIEPLEDIEEISSESSDDEDVNSPEFIPSAWDKYATPTKSALRSPEKTLERSEIKTLKPKGVWFKKQKYHCVYEYPKEPDSPVINHYDIWQPASKTSLDWEVDTSPYIPAYDGQNYSQYDLISSRSSDSDLSTLDGEFYVSSSSRPFESYSGLSQFFPGASDHWIDLSKINDNITPDSGIEDVTPSNEYSNHYKVQTLKILAAMALKQSHINVIKSNKATLGGLRHARNKLKLDLPSSPSAFTYSKVFSLELPEEPIVKSVTPTFTTFGKSRFQVQQVDAPHGDNENGYKNVSFEALPYKPVDPEKSKVEIVRGEASLLDSADEDSGIESSTLEGRSVAH